MRPRPHLTSSLYGDSPASSIGEIAKRLRGISCSLCAGEKGGVRTILNTWMRISEEFPMAIRSVESGFSRLATLAKSRLDTTLLCGLSSQLERSNGSRSHLGSPGIPAHDALLLGFLRLNSMVYRRLLSHIEEDH